MLWIKRTLTWAFWVVYVGLSVETPAACHLFASTTTLLKGGKKNNWPCCGSHRQLLHDAFAPGGVIEGVARESLRGNDPFYPRVFTPDRRLQTALTCRKIPLRISSQVFKKLSVAIAHSWYYGQGLIERARGVDFRCMRSISWFV